MFTGIVEGKGRVLRVDYTGVGRRLTLGIPSDLTEIGLGDSINVSGACLTVVKLGKESLQVDLSSETLQSTTLGSLKEGDEVNLERALRLSDRLGGHIVTGHVDGVGTVLEKRKEAEFVHLRIQVPRRLMRYVVPKGSISIDGTSLTVNECGDEEIELTLIPYTLEKTTLIDKKVGDRVNVETDILGKYVERSLNREKEVSLSLLREYGFVKEE